MMLIIVLGMIFKIFFLLSSNWSAGVGVPLLSLSAALQKPDLKALPAIFHGDAILFLLCHELHSMQDKKFSRRPWGIIFLGPTIINQNVNVNVNFSLLRENSNEQPDKLSLI